METTDLTVSGLASGFYASLAAVGLQKAGTFTTPAGQRLGVLADEDGRLVLVQAIAGRNTQGRPMQLTLARFAGPAFEAA